MFRVDRSQNRLSRLTQKRFSDLKLRERGHLQDWLSTHIRKLEAAFKEPLARLNRQILTHDEEFA
ncbi:hypothetical protein [Paracoccus lutimaris]|uniref:Uncharacterized protein n=1 Tax=Paracoccus lutimaris TaxID=1490030 RepID=A0A368ZBD9_9RHOB|nr:hypothetical protein [Paracoccus lutimaris]RCW88806.1 hypothetical protein DFP89_101242 [Paracoccus lutimaris]